MNALPTRVLVAIAVSALAVVVLGVAWVTGGSGDDGASSTTTSSSSTTTGAPEPTLAPTAISILPDWYRKGSSRYEDRRPVTTIGSGATPTTIARTTTRPSADVSVPVTTTTLRSAGRTTAVPRTTS